MFVGILDKHPPLSKGERQNMNSPWTTNNLVRKIRIRDILRKWSLDLNSETLMHGYRNMTKLM